MWIQGIRSQIIYLAPTNPDIGRRNKRENSLERIREYQLETIMFEIDFQMIFLAMEENMLHIMDMM